MTKFDKNFIGQKEKTEREKKLEDVLNKLTDNYVLLTESTSNSTTNQLNATIINNRIDKIRDKIEKIIANAKIASHDSMKELKEVIEK